MKFAGSSHKRVHWIAAIALGMTLALLGFGQGCGGPIGGSSSQKIKQFNSTNGGGYGGLNGGGLGEQYAINVQRPRSESDPIVPFPTGHYFSFGESNGCANSPANFAAIAEFITGHITVNNAGEVRYRTNFCSPPSLLNPAQVDSAAFNPSVLVYENQILVRKSPVPQSTDELVFTKLLCRKVTQELYVETGMDILVYSKNGQVRADVVRGVLDGIVARRLAYDPVDVQLGRDPSGSLTLVRSTLEFQPGVPALEIRLNASSTEVRLRLNDGQSIGESMSCVRGD